MLEAEASCKVNAEAEMLEALALETVKPEAAESAMEEALVKDMAEAELKDKAPRVELRDREPLATVMEVPSCELSSNQPAVEDREAFWVAACNCKAGALTEAVLEDRVTEEAWVASRRETVAPTREAVPFMLLRVMEVLAAMLSVLPEMVKVLKLMLLRTFRVVKAAAGASKAPVVPEMLS